MTFSEIRRGDYESVLALNMWAVPHVNLIDADQLHWFAEHAAFAETVSIDHKLAGFMIGLRPGSTYPSLNYRWFCEHYDDFAYIDRIVIADWAQRRGVAEKLYTRFAESQVGAPVMTCEVNLRPANDASMAFHRRLGFRQVGSLQSDNGNKEIALMEKHLE